MRILRAGLVMMTMIACGGEEPAAEPAAPPPTEPAATAETVDMGNGDTSMPGDPEAGALVYAETCQPCHAADGRGNGGMTGGDFVGEPVRLQKGNDVLLREIAEGINNGSRVMPPHEDILSAQQRMDALSYVRQQWGESETP